MKSLQRRLKLMLKTRNILVPALVWSVWLLLMTSLTLLSIATFLGGFALFVSMIYAGNQHSRKTLCVFNSNEIQNRKV